MRCADLSARAGWLTSVALERVVAVAASIALTAAAAVSTGFLASNLYHSQDRDYVEALRAGLRADHQVVLLDGGVPDQLISPWYGARATVSTVVGVAPEKPVFDLPSHALRMVRDDGTLAPTLIPMQAVVPSGRCVLRIGYYTNVDAFATIQVAGTQQRFAVRSGLHSIDVVVNGGFINFRATLEDPDATLCLTNASAGVPRPEGR